MSKIIDISLPVFPGGITYPGNPSTEFEVIPSSTGTSVLTKLTLGSHTGTHIDAPSHAFIEGGLTVDELHLDRFYGPVRVVDVTSAKESVKVADLKPQAIKPGERILLKTANSLRGFKEFFPDFVYLSPEGAEYLASQEVYLVGIDSLSIKQKGNPDNTPHTNLLEHGIPILEGVDLGHVDAGEYTLAAFPIRLKGVDGAGCRAVLIKP